MAKGIEVASYDPKKVNVIVGGRTITGFAADGVVSVTKNEDSITPAVGAKGDVTYSENANESGTICLPLHQKSRKQLQRLLKTILARKLLKEPKVTPNTTRRCLRSFVS